MLTDEPPYLSVGTEVSAKYKGAFCEAKVRKVDKTVKCKVSFKLGSGTYTVLDSSIKGTLRVGASVEAKHPEKKDFFEATITKIQDCSQYTVVFDDGDITTLRRSALCLKSGRHFAESETLDQLPLTHPEHFGNPVVGGGGRRGRRRLLDDSSGDEDSTRKGKAKEEKEADIGKVVCVELGDKKKVKDNWFPGLVVSPNAQDTVQIRVKDEYLIRSFSDGRYYTVPKKEASEFTREIGVKVDNNTLKTAVEKALHFIDKDELPPHWDRELLFGLVESDINSDSENDLDSDSSDDEPREEKDHFVAQLYKFMDDRGTPINNCPSVGGKDLDLYKLFNAVHKLNGYNRVTNRNQWKIVSSKLGLGITASIITQVKHAYKKYLHSFEDFYRKLGCTMVSHPRSNRARNKSGRSLIRDRDRATPLNSLKVKCDGSLESAKTTPKTEENSEKDGASETKIKDESISEKKDEKTKVKDEESDKSTKGKPGKKDVDVEEVSESEDSVSVSEEAYSMNRSTSSLRKKFPTLKASPVVVREKRKAEGSPEERKCKRTRVLKSRSSSSSDIKTISDGEEDSKNKEFQFQRNTTRSRSKEDVKTKKDTEKEKKVKSSAFSNSENQKKVLAAKSKRHENEDSHMAKKGRKRRNTETGGKSPSGAEEDLNLPCLPSYKSVFIGDVLKIYYGAPGEPKVIYEAKVVDIKEHESGETMYLVHYAGWNSRYDEWVKRNKIADNLNWTSARSKVVPVTKSSKPSVQKRKPLSNKAEQSAGPGTRSTTPSSITSTSSRHKSPGASLPSGGKRVTRNTGEIKTTKRTRRVSGQTDSESDSDPGDSVSDAESGKKVTKSEAGLKSTPSKKLVKKTPAKKKIIKKPEEKTERESNEDDAAKAKRSKKGGLLKEKEIEEKKSSNEKEGEEEPEQEKDLDEPKGRDFDLNEIRSELKGIDKAVKTNSELAIVESPAEEEKKIVGDEKIAVAAEQPLVALSTATVTVSPVAAVETEGLKEEEEKTPVKVEEKFSDKKDVKEDIYEFKEPEPFEYQEVLRPINRVFEEGDRSPDKTVKKPNAVVEKKEVCKFEVDVKSRFRKTIGKKMKEVSVPEPKKDLVPKIEKVDALSKIETLVSIESHHTKVPEKELPVLKAEAEIRKSLSPEPVRLYPAVAEEHVERKEKPPDKEQPSKPLLEVETCRSPKLSKLSPEPPSLTPAPNTVFGNGRTSASPLLTFIADEGKQIESKKNDNGQEDEDDPISAAIQRVILQSSMDDDSDDMELFPVSSTPNVRSEEPPEAPKPAQSVPVPDSELSPGKKVCSKRKSIGKRIMLSKEFVMDDSSTDSDSDSAEERLVIVNEDESTNDSNRSQKNMGVSTEDDKKPAASAPESRIKKSDEPKISASSSFVETSVPKKFHPGDSPPNKKSGTPAKEEDWKPPKQDKPSEEEGENNIKSLLCEETIPGSPAPVPEAKETAEAKMPDVMGMMRIANVSQSDSLPPPPLTNGKAEGNDANAVMDNTPPTTPESNLSSMSGSPRDDRIGSSSLDNESSKSLRDSSEVDVDNEHQRTKNLKFPKKPDKDPESPLKKKWRNRKRSESLSEVGKRPRQPVGRPPKSLSSKDLGSDSDDTSENSQPGPHNVSNPDSIINSRSQKPSKYNFYCELDPELDASQRIALLEQKLQECRKTYMNVKSKLASLDRRRKKLRRREREEKASGTTGARNLDDACP